MFAIWQISLQACLPYGSGSRFAVWQNGEMSAVLKALREDRRLSQEEVAHAVDLSVSQISRYEAGLRDPKMSELVKLGSFFRVPPAAFFEDEPPSTVDVPLVSWVSAGSLIEPGVEPEIEKWIPIAGLGRGDFFALEVKGDSMDLLSPDGSTIIVDRNRRDLRHERAFIFQHGRETTFKLWNAELPALMPFSSNRRHNPIPVRDDGDFAVIGQVRRTMLDLFL